MPGREPSSLPGTPPSKLLGGATATVVQMGAFGFIAMPVSFGVLLWGGLWLRDPRIRALMPLKK